MPVVDTDYSAYVTITYAIALTALAGAGLWSALRLWGARRRLDEAEKSDPSTTGPSMTGPSTTDSSRQEQSD